MASITTKQEEQHVTDCSEFSPDAIVLCSKCNKPAQPNCKKKIIGKKKCCCNNCRVRRKCKCKGVQYCNNECYRAHWKEHSALCSLFEIAPSISNLQTMNEQQRNSPIVYLARMRTCNRINLLCECIRILQWRQGGRKTCAQSNFYFVSPISTGPSSTNLDQDDDFRNLNRDQSCNRIPGMHW